MVLSNRAIMDVRVVHLYREASILGSFRIWNYIYWSPKHYQWN